MFSNKLLAEAFSQHRIKIQLFRGAQTVREANPRFQKNFTPGIHIFNLRNDRFEEVKNRYQALQQESEEKHVAEAGIPEVAIGPGG